MLTATEEVETDLDVESEDDSEYEYVYPQELIDYWVEIADNMEAKIASGELKPQTVEEVAAELGIILD